MKRKKKFDCVQMKWDIQKQIAEEFAGVPEKEAHEIQAKRIFQNPVLGPLMRRLSSQPRHPRKATG